MKKIAWITDSTAALTNDFIENHDVYVLPLQIIFDDKSYEETVDFTNHSFYEKLEQSPTLPKTSQPALGEFEKLYEELKTKYEKAIAIHASSKLTGTYQSSIMAKDSTGFSVEVIDSKIGSVPLRAMIEKGMELEENGESFETIVSHLKKMPDNAHLIFSPGSLTQLHKSGRVSGTKLLIGNLLQLKLLLNFSDGEVLIHDKVRTLKKVKGKMNDLLAERLQNSSFKRVTILHGNVLEQANEWKEELKKKFSNIDFDVEIFGAVVGVHAGSGTLGLCWND